MLISRDQLVEKLRSIRGATFITFVAETDPKLLKTNNPFKDVRKVSEVNGTLNFHYERAVNRQREREGNEANFKTEERKWGEIVYREDGTPEPIVEYGDKVYLQFKVEKSFDHKYVCEGKELKQEEVAPFLPKKSAAKKQELDKEVLIRNYAINTIRRIKINGESYDVV